MGTNSTLSLEERINGVMQDSPDILHKISKLQPPEGKPIEIVTELPAAIDVDLIIGCVQRWSEIQKYFNRDLRVYAWSHSADVEKYLLGCTLNVSNVYVTVLPMFLKENLKYA